MEEQKKGFLAWVKKHRKELIIAGISTTALIGIIICLKNRDSIEVLWNSMIGAIEKAPTEAPKISKVYIEKIPQSSVTVTDVINSSIIPVINLEIPCQNPFEVSDHIRNLHEGWNASPNKIATAQKYGYNLKQGQTWVDRYRKCDSVA